MPFILQVLWLVVIMALPMAGQARVSYVSPVNLEDQDSVKLGGHISYWVETGKPLTLGNVMALNPPEWKPTQPGYMVLGLTENAYWFQLDLVDNDKIDRQWFLTLRYFFNSSADVYLLEKGQDAQSATLLEQISGWGERHHSLPLPLKAGKSYQLFVRIGVPGPDKFAFVIESAQAKKFFDRWDDRWLGVFYGGFITLVLYNLFLAISTRSVTYGFYILYMLSMLSYLSMMDGFVKAELGRYYVAICAIVVFGCQFCRYFLHTFTTHPFSDRVIKAVIGAAILLALLIEGIGAGIVLTNLVMVLVAGYGMVLGSVGVLLRVRGNQVARFFLLAWIFPMGGMIYTDFMFLGMVPFTDVSYSLMNIVTLIEAILLSMALADRINMLRILRQRSIVDAKQKLEMSNRALEKANRLKDSFLGTISHELRTPMNGIIGTLELLKTTPLDRHQRECMETLGESSTQMLSMVERILLFSELQAGTMRLTPVTVNVAEWAATLQRTWGVAFQQKGLQFTVKNGVVLEPYVAVDIRKLDYLLSELLYNAHKFTPTGSVAVSLEQQIDGETLQWVIEVADTGIGIPAAQLSDIMESFRQVQANYNRPYGGLGIGMAITKEIVAVMGGSWTVASENQQGTVIRVLIPVQKADPLPVDIQPAALSIAAQSGLTSAIDAKILVVEDNLVNQMVMKKILQSLGWAYVLANNGEEAVQATLERPFALILMDCQMPVMDGFVATQTIRQPQNPNCRTPIVAVTANATDQDREHCIAVGMDDYLKKPVKPQDIQAIITRYLPPGSSGDVIASTG